MKIITLKLTILLLTMVMPNSSYAGPYEVEYSTADERIAARREAANKLAEEHDGGFGSEFEDPEDGFVNIDIDLTNPDLQFRDESLATRCLKPYNTAYNAVQGTEHKCIEYDWDGDDYSSDDISGKNRNFYNTQ
jgi:hypothetical protein